MSTEAAVHDQNVFFTAILLFFLAKALWQKKVTICNTCWFAAGNQEEPERDSLGIHRVIPTHSLTNQRQVPLDLLVPIHWEAVKPFGIPRKPPVGRFSLRFQPKNSPIEPRKAIRSPPAFEKLRTTLLLLLLPLQRSCQNLCKIHPN